MISLSKKYKVKSSRDVIYTRSSAMPRGVIDTRNQILNLKSHILILVS